MKKALLIALALGMVVAWAVPAMAVDLTASGVINVGANFGRNTSAWIGGNLSRSVFARSTGADSQYLNHTYDYMTLRAQLSFKVAASADLYGVFMFEMNSDMFGETGRNAAGSSGMGRWGADMDSLQVKNIYVDFRVPPELPVWMRIGIQTYMLRPTIFLYADAAGATARVKVPGINMDINLMYAKTIDRDIYTACENAELYAIEVSLPVGTLKPGAYFAYQDISQSGTPAPVAPLTAPPASVNPDDTKLYWIGAYMTGLIPVGDLNLQPTLDFIYSGGKQLNTAPTVDKDYGSWLFRGTLGVVWNNLEVGVGGMYVTGEDDETPNDIERFQLPRNFSESNVLGGETLIWTGGWGDTLANGMKPPNMAFNLQGIYGFWYLRGYAWYAITNWLKVGAQLAYIGDTEEQRDCMGPTGLSYANGTGLSTDENSLLQNADADDDHGIGWEFDAGVQLTLYRNLKLNTAFGYLFAQKALSLAGGVAPNDPWLLRTVLMYSF
ncbi:MAG: hypothetical protein MUO24_05305 [Desulfobacterales bacterium]|nr:hypothetical protein [Desulfobacterales bacterium]